MKKWIFAIAAALLLIMVSVCIFRYYDTLDYPYPYNDQFVIGNTYEKIVERYGEFDQIERSADGDVLCGVYKIRDDTPELIMSYDDSQWYEIYFEDGIAVRVKLRDGYEGG